MACLEVGSHAAGGVDDSLSYFAAYVDGDADGVGDGEFERGYEGGSVGCGGVFDVRWGCAWG